MLEKKIYATAVESGMAAACRYQLRVKLEDGSTTEISRRAFGHALASAGVGDLIPVRYDPADCSKIELDRHELLERQKAEAREWDAEAIARGEKTLGLSRVRRRRCPLPTRYSRAPATFASATPIET